MNRIGDFLLFWVFLAAGLISMGFLARMAVELIAIGWTMLG